MWWCMCKVERRKEGEGFIVWKVKHLPSQHQMTASGVCCIVLLTPLVEDWDSSGLLSLENHLCKVAWYWWLFIIFLKWLITLSLNKLTFLLTTALSGWYFNNGMCSRPIETQFFNFSTANVTTPSSSTEEISNATSCCTLLTLCCRFVYKNR